MDGDAPEPIEVELVAHEPPSTSAGRWRRQSDSPAPDDPPGDGDEVGSPPDRTDRSRLVAIVGVTAVLSLALGWIVGRSTGGGEVADAPATTRPTTTTVPETLATLPIVGDEIDDPDFAGSETSAPSVTSGPPTTGQRSGPTAEPVGIDARLAGTPLTLVGVELGGVLVEVDLATGTLTDFGASRIVADGRPLTVGRDWVVVAGGYDSSRVIHRDGSESAIDLGDRWPHLHVPGTDHFWRVGFGSPLSSSAAPLDEDRSVSLVGLDGVPLGASAELPLTAWPSSVDPATGGVVVTAGSRNYVVGLVGVDFLADGQLVALSDRTIVTFDCDEALVCGLRRIDRSTGDVAVVPADPELDEELQWQTVQGWGGASTTALSPDQRWVAVFGSSWRTSAAGLIDLATGEFVELARDSFPFDVAWSPDGRFAIVLADGEVIAYDTLTGDRFPVFTDRFQWIQLGARPPVRVEAGADGPTLLSASPEESVEG